MRIPVAQTEKVARLLPSLKIVFSSLMPSAATKAVLQEDIKYKDVFGGARNASSILKTKINMKKISKTEKLSLIFLTIRPINKYMKNNRIAY
tara:strand:+ start:100 stop:375 length:276 start_codon:yes stop_codon:yes gene_type:complete